MPLKTCFIICPIGEVASDTRKRSDQMLKHVYGPVLDSHSYQAVRADKILKSGLITSQVINLIVDSELVIADLTDSNPNVYYELALRHATGKPFIQVAQAGQRIPFDIAGLRTVFVDLANPDDIEVARSDLDGFIKEFKKGHKADSPIQHARGVRLLQTDPDLAESLLDHVKEMAGSGFCSMDDLEEKLGEILSRLDDIESRFD